MDFYKFINSCDIREHLKNMKYEFNAKEAVWLVYRSCEVTLKERVDACRYIVENMPDVPLGDCNNGFIGSFSSSDNANECDDLSDGSPDNADYNTAHQLAKAYAFALEYYLNEFEKQEPGALYSFKYYMEHDLSWCEEYERVYSSLQKCREVINEALDGDKPLSYCIKKHWIDYEKPAITVTFNGDGEVADIDYPWNDETQKILDGFESLGFNFPTPFKKGDVLLLKDYHYPPEEPCLIVMESIASWDKEDENPCMIVYGCFQSEDGSIVQDHTTSPYTDCELYNGAYHGKLRILKLISDYIKGNAGLEELLCFYRKYLYEELANDPSALYFDRNGKY